MKQTVHIIQAPPFWLKTPPLALGYIKTYLQNNDVKVKVLDLNIALFQLFLCSKPQWLTLDKEFENKLFLYTEKLFPYFLENVYRCIENSDIIAFSIFKRNAAFSFSLARKIRQKFPEKTIVFGGPQVLYLDKTIGLNPEYIWVIGEGELPLLHIANNQTKPVFRFEEIKDLDSLPIIDFYPLNIKAYSPTLPLFSSRGCAFRCSFCTEHLLYKKFRCHSPNYIIQQIKYLSQKYSLNNFVFCDSMFNHDNVWLEKFCNLLLKNNLDISWEAQMRISTDFPAELAMLMKKSGCFNLFIGLENGSDRMLQTMNKGFTLSAALKFLTNLKKADLHFEISLILGYPGEEEKDFQETVDFLIKNKHIINKVAQINPFVDYLKDFPETSYPTAQAKQRVKSLISVLQNEKIKYTKSFINNLIY